jgi:hypothetical protein
LLIELLLSLKQFASIDLLICIGGNEFLNDHVAAANSDNQLSIHDLGENLPRTEQIVPVPKALDGNLALHHVEISGKLLINSVSFEWIVDSLACSIT